MRFKRKVALPPGSFRDAHADQRVWSAEDIKIALAVAAKMIFGKKRRTFRENQIKCILAAFAGKDTIANLATGSGKTAIIWGVLLLYDILYNGINRGRRKRAAPNGPACVVFSLQNSLMLVLAYVCVPKFQAMYLTEKNTTSVLQHAGDFWLQSYVHLMG